MSTYIHTQAITLKKRPLNENDRFFTLYTKDFGKISAVAAGAQKIKSKLSGHLEPFGIVNIHCVNTHKNKIIGAIIEKRFENIMSDLANILIAGYCLGLIDKFTLESHRDENIFHLLEASLSYINQESSRERLIFLKSVFILQLLSLLGYKPKLDFCIVCKNQVATTQVKFSIHRGGVICKRCPKENHDIFIDGNTLLNMQSICTHPISEVLKNTIEKENLKTISYISEHYLQYHS